MMNSFFENFRLRRLITAALVLVGPVLLAIAGQASAQNSERVALVIGNAAYRTGALPNPKNDAEAMAELLTKAGFKVDLQVDTDLARLQGAVQKFGTAIRNPSVKFGLFYYAGHGLQQDWRNYLVPVSANIRNGSEVARQTVDVSQLLAYMEHAKGRSFLVILDACRDNPFASTYKAPAKGLSQFDAPLGSLLAYSTSPGKVAYDGDGKNGLYTSYLLQELAVPDVRVEDAFKKVRSHVHEASRGLQVPWESTSLEENLFLFPAAAKALSPGEREALLEAELAHWDEVKKDPDPAALYRFIRKYPSGSASELAQARLNRMLAVRAERDSQEKKESMQAAAAAAALEAEARAELARRKVAEADQKRLEAARLEQERQREALAAAAREDAERQRLAQAMAERERQAQLAAEKARAAEEESKRLAALRQEKERQEAARLALAEAEQARRARAEAEAAQTQLRQAEAVKAQRAAEERQRAQAAENTRLALLRQEEAEKLELARLEREKKALEESRASLLVAAAPVVLEQTPYYKGYAQHDRIFQVGDEHRFQVIDGFNSSSKTVVRRVTKVEPDADRVLFNNGEYVSDLMGNTLVNQTGSNNSIRQFYPSEFFVGKKWTTRFKQSRSNGQSYTFEYKLKVVARETITVPAGTFDTFRIEARGFNVELGAAIERDIWVSPGVSADIAQNYKVRLRSGQFDTNQREELLAYIPVKRRAAN